MYGVEVNQLCQYVYPRAFTGGWSAVAVMRLYDLFIDVWDEVSRKKNSRTQITGFY